MPTVQPSTLGADLVPSASRDEFPHAGTKPGKYQTKLGQNLVSRVATRDEDPSAGTKAGKYISTLSADLVFKGGAGVKEAEAAPAAAAPSSTSFVSRAHLLPPQQLQGADARPPSASRRPPVPTTQPSKPNRCIFTGDDMEEEEPTRPSARDEAWAYRRRGTPSTEHAKLREQRCVFTGDDLPHSSEDSEAWAYMRRWKPKMNMPETLSGIPGFEDRRETEGASGAAAAAGKQEWTYERIWREAVDIDVAKEASRRHADVQKLVANKQENVWGMRMPPRKRGELLSPWAERH